MDGVAESVQSCCTLTGGTGALGLLVGQWLVQYGMGELVHDSSVKVAIILSFTGIHWIKYIELIPHLALPIHTITATAKELCGGVERPPTGCAWPKGASGRGLRRLPTPVQAKQLQ